MSFLTRRILGQHLASIKLTSTTPASHFCRTVLIQRFVSTDTSVNPVPQSFKGTKFQDEPSELIINEPTQGTIDWSKSFHGFSTEPFPKGVIDILQTPVDPEDVDMSPEGLVYLPASSYVKILTEAFGLGGWKLAPRSQPIITEEIVTQEYALICHGRLVSIARGEQGYSNPKDIPIAKERCQNTAMTRCCKDLGIYSDLWNPRWIKAFKRQYCEEEWVEHILTEKKKKIWIKTGDAAKFPYRLADARL